MENQSSIHQVIEALRDSEKPFPPKMLHLFSDLEPQEIRVLKEAWTAISLTRRQALLEDLAELATHDNLLMFEEVGNIGLNDTEDTVIVRAIDLLFDSEDKRLPKTYMAMLSASNRGELVRAAAANALGPFVYYGELEEIPQELLTSIESVLLLATRNDPSDLVRRRALESLGFSGNPIVSTLIRQAAAHEELLWLESALFAMGRSADPVWKTDILENLDHKEQTIQAQAIHAAGELGLDEARPWLIKFLKRSHENDDLRKEAIWALGEIGGEGVVEFLEARLDKAEDDEEYALIEEAIDKANLGTDHALSDLMRFDSEELEEPGHTHHGHDDFSDEEEDADEDAEAYETEWNRYVNEEEEDSDDEFEDSYDFEDPLNYGEDEEDEY